MSRERRLNWTRQLGVMRRTARAEEVLRERPVETPEGDVWDASRLRAVVKRHLRDAQVIVLANREPYIHERASAGVQVLHPASGLVTALEPVMRACPGTWIAHGSGSADRETADEAGRLRVPPGEDTYMLRRVWLDADEEQGYYYGFSNEGLWPLCHVAHARPLFRTSDWEHYKEVNERFAQAVVDEARAPDPVVLVQDYHFALAPRMIREKLPHATIVVFWHIPWPNAERFSILPWEREVLEGLLGASAIGFHTRLHCLNFLEAVDRTLEARIDREEQAVFYRSRKTIVRDWPISVEWPNRWVADAPSAEECRRELVAKLGLEPHVRLGIGVDRLDYTKGIEERLLAVERAVERFCDLRGSFTFVQVAAPSRTTIERYRELGEKVERVAARINERFATPTWRPIALLREHHEPAAVVRCYRAADVCYVSSLHDGMNLVAKEFVSARDDLRGVLVLSRFTGAARELAEALIVNPYDLEEASGALLEALAMQPEEQAARMRALRTTVAEFNVFRWAGRMLVDASRIRRREWLTEAIRKTRKRS